MSEITIASFGAGTDSTAMICGMVERGEKLDHIVFADPGAEKPATYDHVRTFSDWLVKHGQPAVTTVRRAGAIVADKGLAHSLEDECLMRGQLPGIAYGFKSCSDKWKMQPFRTWLKAQALESVTVCIGYDAGEAHRAAKGDEYESGYAKRYPLIEWGWSRDDCIAAIRRAGLEQPGKSSCFFCPSSRKSEVIQLAKQHPDLMARAIKLEQNADLSTIKGLGRRFAWADLVAADRAQDNLFPEVTQDTPCGCFDGAEA